MSGDRAVLLVAPIAALTAVGILLALLGLVVAGNFTITVAGLVAIAVAGVIGLLGRRSD